MSFEKGSLGVWLTAIMVSVSGGFMKLRLYKCHRRVGAHSLKLVSDCFLLFTISHWVCRSLSARQDSLLRLVLPVIRQVAAGILTDWHCKKMCACTFVWYSNQTAGGSRSAVCYQNIRMDIQYEEMRAKLWVLCLPIFCFSSVCLCIIISLLH